MPLKPQEDLAQEAVFRAVEVPPENDGDGKYCTHCGEFLPYKKFHKDASKSDGYRNTCISCRAKITKMEQADRRMQVAMQQLEDKNLTVLETMTAEGGSFTPHLAEVFESIMQPFGGVHGLSKHLFAFYASTPVGSEKRYKVLKMIFEMAKQTTELGLSERKLDQMEEQDLIHAIKRSLGEYQLSNNLPANALPLPDGYVIDNDSSTRKGEAASP